MINTPPIASGREEERRRWTIDALADVDSGHVIDHQAVLVWSDGLDAGSIEPKVAKPRESVTNRLR
jgi:hypothetical protein